MDAQTPEDLRTALLTPLSTWLGTSVEVTYLRSGGSGDVFSVRSGNSEACLKVVRCDKCAKPSEHEKILREAEYLARSAATSAVVPLLNKSFAEFAGDFETANLTLRKARLRLAADNQPILDGDQQRLENLLGDASQFIISFRHSNHLHTGCLTAKGCTLETALEHYSNHIADPDAAADTGRSLRCIRCRTRTPCATEDFFLSLALYLA
jgi:hypothetical protein